MLTSNLRTMRNMVVEDLETITGPGRVEGKSVTANDGCTVKRRESGGNVVVVRSARCPREATLRRNSPTRYDVADS